MKTTAEANAATARAGDQREPDKTAQRTVKPMDPMLRAASKLDKILDGLPPEIAAWAISYQVAKRKVRVESGQSNAS